MGRNRQTSAEHYVELGERRYVVHCNHGGLEIAEDCRGIEHNSRGFRFPSNGYAAVFASGGDLDHESRVEIADEVSSLAGFLEAIAAAMRVGRNPQDAVREVIARWR